MESTMGMDMDNTKGNIFFSFIKVCSIVFLLTSAVFHRSMFPSGMQACFFDYTLL